MAAFALALALIHLTAGLGNYWRWTVQFAASRRLPPFAELAAIYGDPQLLWRIGVFLGGVLLLVLGRKRRPLLAWLAILLLTAPFLWTVVTIVIDGDSSDRAEQLLELWPFLLVVALAAALWNFGWGLRSTFQRSSDAIPNGIALVLPLIVIATIHGAFLSQQVWGSTYAIWPLLLFLCTSTFSTLFPARAAGDAAPRDAQLPASLIAMSLVSVSLLVAGAAYAGSLERMSYINFSEGAMVHSALPELSGLTVRGPWIPDFEGLVRYADANIPAQDGVLLIPGEDLFYYATGRRPQFPVLMFDHTLDPYSPEQIQQMARDRNIRWLIVKKELQVDGEPVEDKNRLLALLLQDFHLAQSVGIYDVYQRE